MSIKIQRSEHKRLYSILTARITTKDYFISNNLTWYVIYLLTILQTYKTGASATTLHKSMAKYKRSMSAPQFKAMLQNLIERGYIISTTKKHPRHYITLSGLNTLQDIETLLSKKIS